MVVEYYSQPLQLLPECYNIQKNVVKLSIFILPKTQELWDKVFNKCFFAFIYILDQQKIHYICDKVISEDNFSITYVPAQYKTQQIS